MNQAPESGAAVTLTTDHWEITECHRDDGAPIQKQQFRNYHGKHTWNEESRVATAGLVASAWAESQAHLDDFIKLDYGYRLKVMVQPYGRTDLSDAVRVIVDVQLSVQADYKSKFTEREWNEDR